MKIEIHYDVSEKRFDFKEEVDVKVSLDDIVYSIEGHEFIELKTYDSSKEEHNSSSWTFDSYLRIAFLSFISKSTLTASVNGFRKKGLFRQNISITEEIFNQEIKIFNSFIKRLFNNYIKEHIKKEKAISLVENIGSLHYYAVLNQNKISISLIEKLISAIIRASVKAPDIWSSLDHRRTWMVQLYPNLATNEWDYLLFPRHPLNYIDCYYDFKDNKIHYLKSRNEFVNRFEVNEIKKIMIWEGENMNTA